MTNIYSSKTIGTRSVPVLIENSITPGIGIHLVGLADQQVKESLLRTVTALQSQGFHIREKIVINLAPADLTKSGSGYDLPIALGILAESGQADLPELDRWLVLGELALDSKVRYVPGCLQAMLCAKETGMKGCIVPEGALRELRPFSEGINVHAVGSLREAMDVISGKGEHPTVWETPVKEEDSEPAEPDTCECLGGNQSALRAIEIAAAGGHNILLIGAPGSGKSSLVKALHALLPPMSVEEAKDTALIYSAAGRQGMDIRRRPFRAPHVSCSHAAMLGGGTGDNIMPGEVSLAHNGVLYLDEVTDAPKNIMEALRAPVEDKQVTISRLKSKTIYPASFLLAVSSNPCPCGYYGEANRCTCTPGQRAAYLSRLSGPVYDHIALQALTHVPTGTTTVSPEPFKDVKERVLKARKVQQERFEGRPYSTNDAIPVNELDTFCHLDEAGKDILERIVTGLGLSARAYTRIIRIARTIADLYGSRDILPQHIAEAASYRFLDRRTF